MIRSRRRPQFAGPAMLMALMVTVLACGFNYDHWLVVDNQANQPIYVKLSYEHDGLGPFVSEVPAKSERVVNGWQKDQYPAAEMLDGDCALLAKGAVVDGEIIFMFQTALFDSKAIVVSVTTDRSMFRAAPAAMTGKCGGTGLA